MAATLNGPLDSTSGAAAVVFSGTGRPGDLVVITINGVAQAVSGTVATNGSFAVAMTATLLSGEGVQAHAGAAGGPSNNTVIVSSAIATPGVPMSASISAGASIITVSGSAGDTVVIISDPDGPGPLPAQALGTALIPAGGQLGISLAQPLLPGQSFTIVANGAGSAPVAVSGSTVPPAAVGVGNILEGSSIVSGTGVAGATVQAVDSQGNVLGTSTVDAQGNFALPVTGAKAGHPVTIIQNGVKGGNDLPSFTLNPEKAFTSANVFNPEKGGTLDIGFRADSDGTVTVKVYNIAGELVRPVFETSAKAGQQFQARWDGKNDSAEIVASGVYFVSVRGAGIRTIRKVVVLK